MGAVPGGRDVLERGEGGSEGGGGGFGWDPPPPRVPLWSPPKAGRKFGTLNPVGAEGTEAKFWLLASNIGRGEGGGGEGLLGGEGGSRGGGVPPPPPTVYGRSNTSLPGAPRMAWVHRMVEPRLGRGGVRM